MNHILRPFRSWSAKRLGPLEQRLLDALWVRGNATVRELLGAGDYEIAYTTMMTTLDRLYKKGLLDRVEDGRAFRYSPLYSREEMHRAIAGEAIQRLFDAGPASQLPLSYLVEILTERDAQLLDDLQKLVERKRTELRKKKEAR